MYEVTVALKYLIPRKKSLSTALIAIMSVGVISLVTWLILIFLSISEGIEKGWLKRLTQLHAPVRITPTQHYFSSYYHNIDSYSQSSDYRLKSLFEKSQATNTDPYDPEEDQELPSHIPEKEYASDAIPLDPVKTLTSILNRLQNDRMILSYQDFEVATAMLKLQLLRSAPMTLAPPAQESVRFISQIAYVCSIPDKNPHLSNLILNPSPEEISHLFYLTARDITEERNDTAPSIKDEPGRLQQTAATTLLSSITSSRFKLLPQFWRINPGQLPENTIFFAHWHNFDNQQPALILASSSSATKKEKELQILQKGGSLYLLKKSKQDPIAPCVPLYISNQLPITILKTDTSSYTSIDRLQFFAQISLQGHCITLSLPANLLSATQGKLDYSPLSLFSLNQAPKAKEIIPHQPEQMPILLAKSYKDNGAMIGDKGFLSFQDSSSVTMQEMRIPVYIAGFYDPGVMSVGIKFILAPKHVTRTIHASSQGQILDKVSTSGFMVWLEEISSAPKTKEFLLSQLQKHGIEKYFSIESYQDFDFSKELLEQFQSDKLLFSVIAILILIIACCNILSLLVILINDKKGEIGALLAMGATPRSLSLLFGTCGAIMGAAGCILGTLLSIATLSQMDAIVAFLSKIQGHNPFNPAFYGDSLPSTLSTSALYFVAIVTPIVSFIAGIIPAMRMCRIHTASILRSE